MPLTAKEARIAADRADGYPAGVPIGHWGSTVAWQAEPVTSLIDDPENGAPEVAVVVSRRMLLSSELVEVYGAMPAATGTKSTEEYSSLLRDNPREIARRLREYAGRLENGENE